MVRLQPFMSFDPTKQDRHMNGQFGERRGSDSDVTLSGGSPETVYDETPPPRTYTIPQHYVPLFEERIAASNRKLERAGADERFTYTIKNSSRDDNGTLVQVADITLDQPTIAIGDYDFLAYHRRAENDRFTTSAQGREVDEPTDGRCDHCHQNRHRSHLYTVQDRNTGEVFQVGSSCLELFFGTRPKGLWALEADEDLDFEDIEYAEGDFRNVGSTAYDADDVLVAAYRATKNGTEYISRDRAAYSGGRATADVVSESLAHAGENGPPTAEELAFVERVKKRLETLGDEEYERNLKAVLAPNDEGDRIVGHKHIGLAASVVSVIARDDRDKNRAAAREAAAERWPKKFYAEPGTQLDKLKVKVAEVKRIPTDFGLMTIVSFEAPDGSLISWKTGSNVEFKSGDETLLRAKVADNTVYQGQHQTVVKRPSFTDAP